MTSNWECAVALPDESLEAYLERQREIKKLTKVEDAAMTGYFSHPHVDPAVAVSGLRKQLCVLEQLSQATC